MKSTLFNFVVDCKEAINGMGVGGFGSSRPNFAALLLRRAMGEGFLCLL